MRYFLALTILISLCTFVLAEEPTHIMTGHIACLSKASMEKFIDAWNLSKDEWADDLFATGECFFTARGTKVTVEERLSAFTYKVSAPNPAGGRVSVFTTDAGLQQVSK